ncbi:hypothetical protein [Nereida ignava]|uniref:hypothetical protein n=1 Tax=Nereida ignava TaxID=282199 RepID=UPI0030FBDCC4
MNQNYGVAAKYGDSLTTREVSGYGTLNPGPGRITPLMGGVSHGEMMGTASDGSSLASYAPIVHGMQVVMGGSNRFVVEGTVVLVHTDDRCKTAAECTTQTDYVAQALQHNDPMPQSPRISGAHVVVSGAHVYPETAVMLSMAVQSVVTVQLDTVASSTESWDAGDIIYVVHTASEDKCQIKLTKTWNSEQCHMFGRVLLPCDRQFDTSCLLCLVPACCPPTAQ